MRTELAHPVLIALVAGAVPAMACEPPVYDPNWRDTPVAVKADCSFDGAEEFPGTRISGSYAQDIGGGRVANIVIDYHVCGLYESLLVTDCNSTETVMVLAPQSTPPASMAGTIDFHESESLFPPKGKLRLSSKTDVTQISAQARRHGYDVTGDVMARIAGMKKQNRYNPYCGCALFYSDSEGAAKAVLRP